MSGPTYYLRRTLITREFAVEARVPPDVLAVWLGRYVGPRRGYLVSPTGPLYQGRVSHQGFKLRRHVNHRSAVLEPTVNGEFRPHSEGTTAHIVVGTPGIGLAVAVATMAFGLLVSFLAGVGLIEARGAAEESNTIWPLVAGPFMALSVSIAGLLVLENGARLAHRDLSQILLGGQPGPSQRWPAPGTRGGPS